MITKHHHHTARVARNLCGHLLTVGAFAAVVAAVAVLPSGWAFGLWLASVVVVAAVLGKGVRA